MVMDFDSRIKIDLVSEVLDSPIIVDIFSTKKFLVLKTNLLDNVSLVRNIHTRQGADVLRFLPGWKRDQVGYFSDERVCICSDHYSTDSASLWMLLVRPLHKGHPI